jgi:cytochrome P450
VPEWIEIDIQKTMRGLIARMFAKIFLGNLVCRDADCLQLLDEYTMDFFLTAFTLKMFPAWAHPIVARFIPARHRLKEKLDTATRIVEPLLGKHLDALNRKNKGEKVDEEDTLLHWLIDNSTPKENNAPAHALRILQLTLASIHSTAAGLSNVVYDLVAHPEWIPGLVEEIAQVTKELGNFDEITDPAEAHRWLSHLEKLDSFIVEVQRHHPAMLRRCRRV